MSDYLKNFRASRHSLTSPFFLKTGTIGIEYGDLDRSMMSRSSILFISFSTASAFAIGIGYGLTRIGVVLDSRILHLYPRIFPGYLVNTSGNCSRISSTYVCSVVGFIFIVLDVIGSVIVFVCIISIFDVVALSLFVNKVCTDDSSIRKVSDCFSKSNNVLYFSKKSLPIIADSFNPVMTINGTWIVCSLILIGRRICLSTFVDLFPTALWTFSPVIGNIGVRLFVFIIFSSSSDEITLISAPEVH